MSLEIWKYVLDEDAEPEMPVGAVVIEVGQQHGKICVWAIVDPSAQRIKREFRVFGTGHQIEAAEELKYEGTAHLESLGLVFHVFSDRRGDPRAGAIIPIDSHH